MSGIYSKYPATSGGSGITSINGDATAAQIITGSAGLGASTSGGTTTVTISNAATVQSALPGAYLALHGTPGNALGAFQTVTWSSNPVIKDTKSAFTYTTGVYLAPYTGYYYANFYTEMANSNSTAASQYNAIDLYDNTTTTILLGGINRFTGATASSTPLTCNGVFFATAADSLHFRITCSDSTHTTYAATNIYGTYASIAFLGPGGT